MGVFRTYSSAETKRIGEAVAKKILREKRPVFAKTQGALVLALEGDLGAGKTTFMQGFLKGLGVKKRTASPTFILMRRFRLRKKYFKNLYHLDAYRIKKSEELFHLGLGEILLHPQNIVAIEWAERVKKILPRGTKKITFMHGKKEEERKIMIK